MRKLIIKFLKRKINFLDRLLSGRHSSTLHRISILSWSRSLPLLVVLLLPLQVFQSLNVSPSPNRDFDTINDRLLMTAMYPPGACSMYQKFWHKLPFSAYALYSATQRTALGGCWRSSLLLGLVFGLPSLVRSRLHPVSSLVLVWSSVLQFDARDAEVQR